MPNPFFFFFSPPPRARKARGENNAFIDPEGVARYVTQSRDAFEKQLAAQRAQP
ncbi:hypothetical protein BN132_3628 [Cronobacter turicensis 564]|nr:hypothetical protein BN132_3628 [Cronobacter turicensis 564]